jgi:hypothetical protein
MVAFMSAWHGDEAVKAKYIARVEAHRLADEIIRGVGWEDGKGCAVGCTFDNYDHARGPVEIGVPEWLMWLEDAIFEGLPYEKAILWPTQFLSAIPVGANLEPVRWQLAILRHKRQLEVLAANREPYAREVEQALQLTVEFCEMMLTETAKSLATEAAREAWSADAAEAAWSAAVSAAEAARSAAVLATEAAEAAAESAVSAAESAVSAEESVESAAWSAWLAGLAGSTVWAAESAGLAHYEWEAETLLVLLRDTVNAI